ncbi:sensor histidine kinase [Micromonospora endophytica]|uniref:Sensor histidine kinase n=1 Tax=Micromonospora endophytica TaxID=515350 RepID=A0A2W2CXE0_9ACTN|nr:sensor histidine kinase [Micromonospora endophytica]RIW44697.1 sensor histidine kinase [Micromonospora endophytica]
MVTHVPVPGGFEVPLWRAIAVYRVASLAYVCLVVARDADQYAHPLAAAALVLVMAVWTAVTAVGYAEPSRRGWPLLLADLAVVVAILLVTPAVMGGAALAAGLPTLSVAWLGGPVLAWAVSGGRRRGATAALVLAATDLGTRGMVTSYGLNGAILMLLAGVVVGHVARLAVSTEERLQRAVELEAATRERERLARDIHDSVLQVLALVQRRGAHLDGEAGELARLAGEQEVALRELISGAGPAPTGAADTPVDLRGLLGRYASATVSLSAPATPVPLPPPVARELAAAAGAALDNAARHGGGRAWVLLEDEGTAVTVSIRDEGPGFAPDRLAEAAAQGRLGVAQAIRGRLAEIGGTTRIHSAPGSGTEVELTVPRR